MFRARGQLLLKYSIFIFIFAYPFSIKLSNLALIIIVILAFITSSLHDKRKRILENWQLLIYPFYFILLLFGLLYTSNLYYGGKILESSIPFLILPLFLGTAPMFTERDKNRIFLSIVASALVASMYCVIMNLKFLSENDLEFRYFFYWEYAHEHLTSFIGFHPTYFAVFILISILIVLFVFLWDSVVKSILNILLLGFFAFFLFMLGSKIGIVLMILVALVGGAKIVKKGSAKLIPVLIILATSIAILGYKTPVVYWRFKSSFDSVVSLLSKNKIKDYDYRLFHWTCALQKIKEEPLVGFGTGDFLEQLNNCYAGLERKDLIDFNSHNQFFDLWIALGITGLFVCFVTFIAPIYLSFRRNNFLFISISLVFFFVSLTESIFWSQKGIVLFCFFTSIIIAHDGRNLTTDLRKDI
jgi:O-antigen ligase